MSRNLYTSRFVAGWAEIVDLFSNWHPQLLRELNSQVSWRNIAATGLGSIGLQAAFCGYRSTLIPPYSELGVYSSDMPLLRPNLQAFRAWAQQNYTRSGWWRAMCWDDRAPAILAVLINIGIALAVWIVPISIVLKMSSIDVVIWGFGVAMTIDRCAKIG